jgi:hypothetical protein
VIVVQHHLALQAGLIVAGKHDIARFHQRAQFVDERMRAVGFGDGGQNRCGGGSA